MSSQFDCKLTPSKTELLVIGYSKLFTHTFIPTDIISFFIAYFNEIIYFNHKMCGISVNYIINDLIFKVTRKNYTTFSLQLLTKICSIKSIIVRIRLFSVEYFPETHQIIQISHSIPIELGITIFDNSDPDIGIEIETLHIEWNNGNVWSKWRYPWTNNSNDMQLFMNDNWFIEHFNSYCFGVNGKYYLAKQPTLKHYIKCRSLSKFNNIMMLTMFNDIFARIDYTALRFMRLTSLVMAQKDEIKATIMNVNNQLKQLKDIAVNATKHKGVSECITKYEQFKDELTLLIYPIGMQTSNTMETTKWRKKSLRMKKQSNIYSQYKTIKNHRTYINNKRKHKYNRW
eukprot:337519_1